MPTYEYVCRDCGHHLEVVQSFRDEPLTVCSRCEGSLRKVFSPAGIIFKGSGYYVTDSRPKPASEPASGDGAAASGTGGETDAAKSGDGGTANAKDTGGSSSKGSGSKGSGSKGSGSKGSGSKGSGDTAQSA